MKYILAIAFVFVGFSTAHAATILDSNGVPMSQSATPSAASSVTCQIPKDIPGLFNYALCVLDSSVIPFLIGMGLILFLAGVVKFVGAGDNEEKRAAGREMMMFGIIALFVMVSVWGFVNILNNSIFGKNAEILSLPKKSATVFAPSN